MTKTKTETETKVVKLTEDEIKEVGDLRSSISNVTLVIGETEIAFANLETRKKELMSRLLKLSEKQNDVAKKLEVKYGNGNVNLDTNEFTPTK
jgi:septation ring formation regulator EzrA